MSKWMVRFFLSFHSWDAGKISSNESQNVKTCSLDSNEKTNRCYSYLKRVQDFTWIAPNSMISTIQIKRHTHTKTHRHTHIFISAAICFDVVKSVHSLCFVRYSQSFGLSLRQCKAICRNCNDKCCSMCLPTIFRYKTIQTFIHAISFIALHEFHILSPSSSLSHPIVFHFSLRWMMRIHETHTCTRLFEVIFWFIISLIYRNKKNHLISLHLLWNHWECQMDDNVYRIFKNAHTLSVLQKFNIYLKNV